MKGISEFSDFEYFYDENKNLQYILARNQTRMLESKRYESSELIELWEHSFESISSCIEFLLLLDLRSMLFVVSFLLC